ncbi:hypothetical protein [Kurthia sibirica]|uniref:Uncharacterized protein n=1 Tax=Kurthia sibirica TaxID=202750 RepID=A0A2U3AJ13_9BACL|nr:hypothetical protein [Kurthia sibirica]PWI24497.1 hypothetical protein DEX24_12965 [Kurthia sibirica]GEK33562.1 hypothetical protein KSI01_10950 [Kurthia sibirica]
MTILRFIIIYVVILALGMLAAVLGVPQAVSLSVFTAVAIILVVSYMYAMTGAKDSKWPLLAIRFQKKSPMFAYIFALRDGTLEDELEAVSLIEKKVKNQETVLDYQFLRALRLNDLSGAKAIISTMKTSPRKRFNIAIHDAANKKYGVARSHKLDFIWMEYYIEAYIALVQHNKEKYIEFMEKAIEETKGLQKLTNESTYARDLREWQDRPKSKK